MCDGSALGLGSCLGFGAAYGTAKSGVGIASMGVMRPELVMKSIVPVVMAGVLGIYGLIIAVIISTGSESLFLTPGVKLMFCKGLYDDDPESVPSLLDGVLRTAPSCL